VVEQRFRKPPVGSSSLPVGSGRVRTRQVVSAVVTWLPTTTLTTIHDEIPPRLNALFQAQHEIAGKFEALEA
jgi:hypothetical protein